MKWTLLMCLLLVTTIRPAAGQSKERMQFASVGGRPVAYHVLGTAPGGPLLFINGGPGFDHSFHHLSPVWEQLAGKRRVVFFDQPGTGQSWPVGPKDSVSLAEVIDSMEAIRKALDVPRLVLIGHSWGGYVAMTYALRYPANVEAMILVDSVAANIASSESLHGALFPDIVGQLRGLSAEYPDQVQKYIRLTTAMSFYSPEIRDRIIAAMGRVEYNSRLEVLEKEAAAHDLTAKLSALAMPVLVTTGRFDGLSPRTAWRLHQAIPGSKWVVFERSGHFPMLEEPEAFVKAIEEFLRQPQTHGALKGVPGVNYVDRGFSRLITNRTEPSRPKRLGPNWVQNPAFFGPFSASSAGKGSRINET